MPLLVEYQFPEIKVVFNNDNLYYYSYKTNNKAIKKSNSMEIRKQIFTKYLNIA